MAVVSTRSTAFSTRHSSSIEPASVTVRLLRLNPVAIFVPSVAPGSRSPAICSMTNSIERLVAVEGRDHPVAPGPHRAGEVVLVAVGVGVAGHVEPVHRHPLAVARRGQQPVDQLLVGVWETCSARKASTSAGVGGRPVRSSVSAADQRGCDRPRATASAFSASSRARTKRSIGFSASAVSCTAGGADAAGRLEGPVLAPPGTLVDPSPEQSPSARSLSLRPDFGGGITSSASSLGSAVISSLSALLPGTMTGSFVRSALSLMSSRRSALRSWRPARGRGSSSPRGSARHRG